MADELKSKEIALKGKYIPALDPATIGENFQTLTNLRYKDVNIQAVDGMTKINTSIIDATYFKARSGFHYVKKQPAESHVLVQSWNTGVTASEVNVNTTAIPGAGNFTATALYTDDTDADIGVFSKAPNASVAYTNGEEACIWGGNEFRVASFINYDPAGTFKYDYTEEVRNDINDASNRATLSRGGGGQDGNCLLLMHFDNNEDDAVGTHAPDFDTGNNGTYVTGTKKFGTHAGEFNGTNAQVTIADHADFDLSGGEFTIDVWVNCDNLAKGMIYCQDSGAADYFKIWIDSNGAVNVSLFAAGAETLSTGFKTANSVCSTNTWYHIAVVEDGNDWYIFVDGILRAYLSDASRCANFTDVARIGYDETTYFDGTMDEFRLSDSARWTAGFQPPNQAYTATTVTPYMYIGSTRPLQGFKLYIGTGNTTTSTMSVDYWDGSAWTSVASLSDGTSSGTDSLAATGSVTFTSTAATAKIKYIDGYLLYFYRVSVDACDASVTIYYVTLDAPFQTIKDIWDGTPRTVLSFQLYYPATASYGNFTLQVYANEYVSTNTGTFVNIGAVSSTHALYFGFSERTTAIGLALQSGNTTANTILTVYYWNGTAWTSVGTITDGTIEGAKALAKSGVISWDPPASTSEFKTEIGQTGLLYYYKIVVSQTLSATVNLYYAYGIPAQKTIKGHKYCTSSDNRLWLCGEKGAQNRATCSATSTAVVFNGGDSVTFEFGDDSALTGAAYLYSQFGSSLYSIRMFFKPHEIWMIVGDTVESWYQYRLTEQDGCAAPLTLQTIDLPPREAATLNRTLAIWQGLNGIYMSDGRTPIPIHYDIENYFDKDQDEVITAAMIGKSVGFVDKEKLEYHWLFASDGATTLNKELVYDLRRGKWFEIDRATGNYLQCGFSVEDTSGNNYTYGSIDTGYVERLENGDDFDGTDLTCTFQLGDMPLGSLSVETLVRNIKLITTAQASTANDVTCTHYGDSETTGTDITMDQGRSGYRLADTTKSHALGAHVFHSTKFAFTR